MKYIAYTLIVLYSLGCLTFECQTYAYETIISEQDIEVDPITRKIWRNDLFQSKEIIVIDDIIELLLNLSKKFDNPEALAYIRKKIVKDLPKHLGPLYSIYSVPIKYNSGFLLLSEKEKRLIPPKILNEIMYTSFHSGLGPPSIEGDKRFFQQSFSRWTTNKKERRILNQRLLNFDFTKSLPLTPETWSFLDENLKDEFIDSFVDYNRDEPYKSLSISLKLKTKLDIEEILEKYSTKENHKEMKIYLYDLFTKNHPHEFTVPLENILAPFIKEKINTFDIIGGPNCFNAGICVGQGEDFKPRYVGPNELTTTLKKSYRPLGVMEKLQIGDLILYKDSKGAPIHVATYINDEIVFTKNGINKFKPYMFQYKTDMEKIYFSEDDFQLFAYRQVNDPRLDRLHPPKGASFKNPNCTSDVIKKLVP